MNGLTPGTSREASRLAKEIDDLWRRTNGRGKKDLPLEQRTQCYRDADLLRDVRELLEKLALGGS